MTRRPAALPTTLFALPAWWVVAVAVAASALALVGIAGQVVPAALAVAAFPIVAAVWARPQRGVLLLVGLLPFDGLLLLVDVPQAVTGWKEALVLVTAVAAARPGPGRRGLDDPLPSWLAPMAAMVTLSLLSAYGLGIVQLAVGMKVAFFGMGLALVVLRCPLDARDRDRLVSILALTGALAAAYGVAQQLLGPARLNAMGYPYNSVTRFTGGFMRSWSTFNQPFPFAFHLMLVTLVCGATALADPRRTRNLVVLLAMPLYLTGILVAVVRAAWIGLACGVLYLAVVRYRHLWRGAPVVVAGVVVALLLGAGGFFSPPSLEARQDRWADVLPVAVREPLGHGIGSAGAAAARSEALTGGQATFDPGAVGARRLVFQPDNTYVKVLYEVGPFGLVAFIALLASALATSRRAEADPDAGGLAAGISAFVVASVVAGLASTFFEIFPLDYLFWTLVGMVSVVDVRPIGRPVLLQRTQAPAVPRR